jgi:hypothetical protein
MKRIVRDKATRAYLSADGKWASDHQVAQEFPNMNSVWSVIQKQRLTGVELVLVVGESRSDDYDIVLPLVSWPASVGRTYDGK